MLRKQPAMPASTPDTASVKNLIRSGSMPAALAAATFSPVALIRRPIVALFMMKWITTTAASAIQTKK